MKQCPKCGKNFDSAFCPDCGTPMEEAPPIAPTETPLPAAGPDHAETPAPGEEGVDLFKVVPGWIWATAAIVILVVILFARGAGSRPDGKQNVSSRPAYTDAQLDTMFSGASPFLPALHQTDPTHYADKPVYITGKVVDIESIDYNYYMATIATKRTTAQPDEYTTDFVHVLYPFTIPGASFYEDDIITAYGYVTDQWANSHHYPVIDTYRADMVCDASDSSSAPTSSAAPAVKKYPAGMYKVGTDIPAGLYVLTADDGSAYYEVCSDSSGTFDSILHNENFNGRCYLELTAGQYVSLKWCTAISFDDAKPLTPTSGTLSGDWLKVGFDIAPGEYRLTATSDKGYCAVYSRAVADFDHIVVNGNFSGSRYITVKSGQYLQLSRCVLTMK